MPNKSPDILIQELAEILNRCDPETWQSLLPSMEPDMFSDLGFNEPTITESTRMPVSRVESSQPVNSTG